MKTTFFKSTATVLLTVLMTFLSFSCKDEGILSTKEKLSYNDLRTKIKSDSDFIHLISLIRKRQLSLNNTISGISTDDYIKLQTIRSKYTSYKDFKNRANEKEQSFFSSFFADAQETKEISTSHISLVNKLKQGFEFEERDLDKIIIDIYTENRASLRTQQDDCMLQCFDRGSDAYHATYYTARWELGYSENDAYFFADLAYQWYMIGCQDGCKGNQK